MHATARSMLLSEFRLSQKITHSLYQNDGFLLTEVKVIWPETITLHLRSYRLLRLRCHIPDKESIASASEGRHYKRTPALIGRTSLQIQVYDFRVSWSSVEQYNKIQPKQACTDRDNVVVETERTVVIGPDRQSKQRLAM